MRYLASAHVLKPPVGNRLLILLHYHVLGLLNVAIGGFLKRSAILLLVKNGQIIFKGAVKVVKGRMKGRDKRNPAFVCILFVLQKGFPVFCNNLINCRLDCVGFIASITRI